MDNSCSKMNCGTCPARPLKVVTQLKKRPLDEPVQMPLGLEARMDGIMHVKRLQKIVY